MQMIITPVSAFSTFSALRREDGLLECTMPDIGPLPLARSLTGVALFTRRTIREFLFMTTSQHLPQIDLFGMALDFPTSSSEARRAKTSAARTPKAKVSTGSEAASTSKPSASSMNADLVGSLLKIALISELEAQTGLSMRWRQSATPAGHSWLVLETSAPTTSESEAGSSVMMGTPTANPAPRGSVLRRMKDCMTNSQDDFDRSPNPGEMVHFFNREMFHTPTAKANFAADSMIKWESCQPWNVMLAKLPTPVKPNGGRTLSKEAIETGKRANGQKAQIDTPNILRYALETLPTPTKRDKRLDSWSPAYDRRKSPTMDAVMDGAMTGKASDKWAGARALAELLQSHGLTGTAALPITYGWMMGYPPGWLSRALQSAVREGRLQLASSSKPSATLSARKSPKQ